MSAKLCGLASVPIKKRLIASSVTRRQEDQLIALLRVMLSLCIRSRNYGYFYFDTMLTALFAGEQKRAGGYTKRQLMRLMHLLSDCGLIVFQLDALYQGGLYRVAFYDAGNLNKQEYQVSLYAKTLRKNLTISHTCPKMRRHSYRAKALGIEAIRELALAQDRCEKHKAEDKRRRRAREAERRKRLATAAQVEANALQAASRPVKQATQALTPVSIPKLVTTTLQASGRKVRRVDRSGGALGHYRDKLVAMGLTRAVQEYDRIQHARDMR